MAAVSGGRTVVAGGDRSIPPEMKPHVPRTPAPVQSTSWESGTGIICRQKAVPARQKTEIPADSRQPSLLRLSPVATPEFNSAGAGKWPHDPDTDREGTGDLPEVRRRRFAAPDAAAPVVPVVATTVVGLPASSLVDSVRR